MSRSPRVIVVGAGVGGLALAHALVSAGIDVTVHERNASAGQWLHGYRINVNPDGARALHACLPADLWQAFVATSATPAGGITFRTETLRELFTLTRADMVPSSSAEDGQYGVSRVVLRQILLAGLDDVVRFDAEFERYTVEAGGQVTAHFADGTAATGDVLVGADGANSRVRTQLLPHAHRVGTGATAIAGRLPLTDATRAWLPDFLVDGMALVMPGSGRWTVFTSAFPGRDTITGAVADGLDLAALGVDRDVVIDDIDDYVLCALIADRRSLPADLDRIDGATLSGIAAGMVCDWHPALRRMFAACDPATVAPLELRQSVAVDPWPSSAVTVLGDAVHNMSPVGGLGANTALRDAAELAQRLIAVRDGAPLVPAIAVYEERMREWGYAAVRDAADNTRRATTSNRLTRRAGRTYFRARARCGPELADRPEGCILLSVWTHDVGADELAATPACTGDLVVFGVSPRHEPLNRVASAAVRAIRRDDGTPVWEYRGPAELGARMRLAPVLGPDTAYVAGSHELVALALSDGALRWRVRAQGPALPVLVDGVLYASRDSELLVLDPASGRITGRRGCRFPIDAIAVDPGGDLLLSTMSSRVLRLDPVTLEIRQTYRLTGGWAVGTPVVVDQDRGLLVINSYGSFLVALDATTGSVRWRRKKATGQLGAAMAVPGGRVVCTTTDMVMVTAADGRVAWTVPGPVLYAELDGDAAYALIFDDDHSCDLVVVDLATGTTTLRQPFDTATGHRLGGWDAAAGLTVRDGVAYAAHPAGSIRAVELRSPG